MSVHFGARNASQKRIIVAEADVLVAIQQIGRCGYSSAKGGDRGVTGSNELLGLLGTDTVDLLERTEGGRTVSSFGGDRKGSFCEDRGDLLADLRAETISGGGGWQICDRCDGVGQCLECLDGGHVGADFESAGGLCGGEFAERLQLGDDLGLLVHCGCILSAGGCLGSCCEADGHQLLLRAMVVRWSCDGRAIGPAVRIRCRG